MITRSSLRSSKRVEEAVPDPSFPLVPPCISFKIVSSSDTRSSNSNSSSSNSSIRASSQIRIIPHGSPLPSINADELRILRAKQAKLRKTYRSIEATLPPPASSSSVRAAASALASTLIFAQYEAGTAVVCAGSAGDTVLTCAHCFGDSEAEWRANSRKWLLYYTGQAVLVECRRWDPRRDLALASIVAIESPPPPSLAQPNASTSSSNAATSSSGAGASSSHGTTPTFTYLPVSAASRARTPILCIGQPGRDDLESTTGPRKTTYNLVEVSEGVCRGLVPKVNPHDCSAIGTLMHDAWTYWGHSGAPLVNALDGTLLGLHSSWDDVTAMRHGVPAVAIRAFLEEVEYSNRSEYASDSGGGVGNEENIEVVDLTAD